MSEKETQLDILERLFPDEEGLRDNVKSLKEERDRYREILAEISNLCVDLRVIPVGDDGPHPFVIMVHALANKLWEK